MRAPVLLLLLCASCLRATEFHCQIDQQCDRAAGGKCEAIGSCSYLDRECSSGRRFDDTAGSRSGQCAGEPSGGDGGIEGPPSACPADYLPLPNGAAPTHRYRRAPLSLIWLEQHNACVATSPRAYLAIPDDAAELSGLAMLAAATRFWVGINDQAVEGTYLRVLGGAATFLPWAAGQPDDAGTGEDCVSASATSFNDEACGIAAVAVCECEL